MTRLFSLALLATLVASAHAAVVLDGTRDSLYGPALAVQTVQTQFGDNFSEWNAGYGASYAGKLNLMATGNLEDNFNKLEIFIDANAGGQTVLDAVGNDNTNVIDGVVFDNGFTPETHLVIRRGADGTPKFDVDFADLVGQTSTFYERVFGDFNEGAGTTGTGVNQFPIGVAFDNSNTAGVLGGTGAADTAAALAVTTGLELSIDLRDLGWDGGPINVMIAQNGGNHDFWSNQFLGGLPAGTGNLGNSPLAIDLTAIDGDQFFTVRVPEPTSALLVGVALVGIAARRRR